MLTKKEKKYLPFQVITLLYFSVSQSQEMKQSRTFPRYYTAFLLPSLWPQNNQIKYKFVVLLHLLHWKNAIIGRSSWAPGAKDGTDCCFLLQPTSAFPEKHTEGQKNVVDNKIQRFIEQNRARQWSLYIQWEFRTMKQNMPYTHGHDTLVKCHSEVLCQTW